MEEQHQYLTPFKQHVLNSVYVGEYSASSRAPTVCVCACRTAVLEYLVAHVQAGRMLMAQQSTGRQEGEGGGNGEDTHMESASPTRLNVCTHKRRPLCSKSLSWHFLALCQYASFKPRLQLPCSVDPLTCLVPRAV